MKIKIRGWYRKRTPKFEEHEANWSMSGGSGGRFFGFHAKRPIFKGLEDTGTEEHIHFQWSYEEVEKLRPLLDEFLEKYAMKHAVPQ